MQHYKLASKGRSLAAKDCAHLTVLAGRPNLSAAGYNVHNQIPRYLSPRKQYMKSCNNSKCLTQCSVLAEFRSWYLWYSSVIYFFQVLIIRHNNFASITVHVIICFTKRILQLSYFYITNDAPIPVVSLAYRTGCNVHLFENGLLCDSKSIATHPAVNAERATTPMLRSSTANMTIDHVPESTATCNTHCLTWVHVLFLHASYVLFTPCQQISR